MSWFTDEPTTKIDPRLPRVVGLQDTLMRVRALKRALPVTRVADLSPLDRASLPVFCVVTPLARDLTTHLGKGATPLAAEVSAWMEAVERIAGETVPGPHDPCAPCRSARPRAGRDRSRRLCPAARYAVFTRCSP